MTDLLLLSHDKNLQTKLLCSKSQTLRALSITGQHLTGWSLKYKQNYFVLSFYFKHINLKINLS